MQELIRDGHLRSVKERGALPSDSYIDRDLATVTTNWRLERLSAIDRSVLRPKVPTSTASVAISSVRNRRARFRSSSLASSRPV